MTDYHPITKEELERIVSGCAFPQNFCEECIDYTPYGCTTNGVLSLMDEILSRPDPLEMLEAWTDHEYDKLQNCDGYEEIIDFLKNLVYYQKKVIKQLRTDPAAVREQGIREGWWVE